MTQGMEANRAGRILEIIVERTLREYGVHVCPYSHEQDNGDLLASVLLIRDVPYTNLYGGTSRSEFVLDDKVRKRRVRIECRYQRVAGSVDEKFPYFISNAEDCMPEGEVVLVVDGEGAKPEAKEWLRAQAAKSQKDIRVVNMNQFLVWAKEFFA